MKRIAYFLLLSTGLIPGPAREARAQAVAVTVRLDTNVIAIGGTTLLRVYAQVAQAHQTNADRIFSWYVNVLNTNRAVAQANYAALSRSTSDNDPATSSSGFTTNASRFGIYDTFLNLPGAGVTNPVELVSIPVNGAVTGLTAFRVEAGSGVPSLSSDFIVAPLGGGVPWTGGDYSAAVTNLQVVNPPVCPVLLQLSALSNNLMRLAFTTCPAYNHTIEAATALRPAAVWQALPGGPHNSGNVLLTNTAPRQFFRVLVAPP